MTNKAFRLEEQSSWVVLKNTFFSLNKGRVLVIMACLLFLIYGCSGKKTTVMAPQKTSIGDVKLTAEQKRIFYTTGQLDRNLPSKAMPSIARQYSRFLNESRSTMANFAQRSEPFLGHAREIFRRNGMPEELAYLALVESGYKHTAKSHAGAAGTWQFMPYTGRHYGLHQDRYIDERLDPYESVEAAAKYLKALHNMFGDWLLAVASYNAGQGKIQRALKASGAKDFFTLVARNNHLTGKTQLRTETLLYVPRFLAMTKIMRNLKALGFEHVDHNQPPQHTRIVVEPNTDLRGLARAVDVPYEEFRKINAAHKKHRTHRSRETYVYVPTSERSAAKKYASSGKSTRSTPMYSKNTPKAKPQNTAARKEKLQARTYIVKSGDSLSRIAARHNVSTVALAKVNKINKDSTLRVGQRLSIPKGGTLVSSNTKNTPKRKKTYKVKRGDTASAIASKYNLTIKQLLRLNKKSSTNLRAGETLLVSQL